MNYQQRLAGVHEGHARLVARWHELNAAEGPPPEDQTDWSASPGWQSWYDEFLPISEEMYRLADDLGISFDPEVATSESYADVWRRVQEELTNDGNRRRARLT